MQMKTMSESMLVNLNLRKLNDKFGEAWIGMEIYL